MKNNVILRNKNDGENNQNKNYGSLKKIIIQEIIKDKIQSNLDIKRKFNDEKNLKQFSNVNETSIIRTFTQLLKDDWLGRNSDGGHKAGGFEKFYGLTEKGIQSIIKEYKLSDDEFWKICINYLNPEYKYRKPITNEIKQKRKNKTITISKIDFEQNYQHIRLSTSELFKQQYPSLEYYKDYFNPFGTDKIFGLIQNLIEKDREFLDDSILILQELGIKPNTDVNNLFEKHEKIIIEMYEKGLLYTINDEPKISIFGIIVLLLVFPKKYESLLLEHGISQTRTINSIIKKQEKSLPLVFSKWEKLRKICNNDEKLFETLSRIFLIDFDKILGQSFKIPEMRILVDQYTIENDYVRTLRRITSSGTSCLLSWSNKNGFKDYLFDDNLQLKKDFKNHEKYEGIKPYLQTIRKIQSLDRMFGYYKWNELGFLDVNTNNNDNELTSIQNTISLYFYTQLRIDFYGNSKLEKFLEEDEEIRNWWNNWIDVTTQYNKESRELMKLKEINKQ